MRKKLMRKFSKWGFFTKLFGRKKDKDKEKEKEKQVNRNSIEKKETKPTPSKVIFVAYIHLIFL
jgi:hypothetical protein